MLTNGRIIISTCMCLFFSVVIITAFTNSSEARIVPLLTGVPGLLMSIMQLKDEIHSTITDFHPVEPNWPDTKAITLTGWFFILILATVIIGNIPASTIFIAAFLWLHEKRGILKALLVAVIFNSLIYFLFELVLKIPLFTGVMDFHAG